MAVATTFETTDPNKAVWARERTAFSYRNFTEMFAPERVIFDGMSDLLARSSLLDIGIGAGRTTHFLLPACGQYVGVDYSAEMIKRAHRSYPAADLRVMDARELALDDASFDVAFFSFNGMDYVGHEDRLRILAGIHRVLRPGGKFVFSSHQRGAPQLAAHDIRNLKLTVNPLRLANNVVKYAAGVWNARRNKSREVETTDFAILNDSANQYRLLTYYISRAAQVGQLTAAGFETEAQYRLDGSRITAPQALDPASQTDYMIHYVARRP